MPEVYHVRQGNSEHILLKDPGVLPAQEVRKYGYYGCGRLHRKPDRTYEAQFRSPSRSDMPLKAPDSQRNLHPGSLS